MTAVVLVEPAGLCTGNLTMTDVSPASQTSRLAVASLVMTCLSLFIGPFGFVPGIVLGHIARSKCRKDTMISGDRIALTSLIIGYSFLVLTVILVSLFVVFLVLTARSSVDPFIETLF